MGPSRAVQAGLDGRLNETMGVVMRVGRIGVAVAAVAVLASACGGLANDDTDSGGTTGATGAKGIEHPTGADQLILRVAYEGGFVPYEYTFGSTPFWSLFGDGTLIVPGPQIEIYPGPVLPNLTATPLSEDGIQAILEAARDAGLMDGDANYGNQCIADAATTVFTTDADGQTSVVSAYALDVGEPAGTCGNGKDADARARLAEFQAKLTDLRSWLPDGSLGTERPYDPTEMRVYVLPYQGDAELPQDPIEWPLEPPLDAFGEPVQNAPAATRCGVVTGEDLATLLAAAKDANALTPWTSGGTDYQLIFRPLLPDEHACQPREGSPEEAP
jgi:hypothetical protein